MVVIYKLQTLCHTAVANMFSSKHYIKYTFCVILYICVCKLCLMLAANYSELSKSHVKSNTSNNQCNLRKSNASFVNKKKDPFSLTIKELEYDAIRGEVINEANFLYPQSALRVCSNQNLSTNIVKRHYLYSANNNLVYCWIRKAASTSFTKLFSNSWNRSVTQDYYKEIDILAPKTNEQIQNLVNDKNVFKLLVVRHPFERIVSSYRDRIEDNKKYTAQAWVYAQKIFHLTRPSLFVANGKDGNSLSRIFDNDKRLKVIPTFKEFITWLLQEPTSKDDVHWDSYYSHCSVCDIKYNFVMKLENYSFGEIDFIISKMGLNKDKVYMPRLEETKGGFTDYKTTCSYFKPLSRDMITKLYQRYKIDFQMFDYKYENYLNCTTS